MTKADYAWLATLLFGVGSGWFLRFLFCEWLPRQERETGERWRADRLQRLSGDGARVRLVRTPYDWSHE